MVLSISGSRKLPLIPSSLPVVDMPSVYLPPELLIEIIEVVGGDLPSRNESQYKARRANLRSLSLVNSLFRPIAQSLLPKEIWRRDRDKTAVFLSFVRDPSKGSAVQHFGWGFRHISGPWILTLNLICTWSNLKTLTFVGASRHPVAFSFDGLGCLPNLQEVSLEHCAISPGTLNIQLPHLRRLVFITCGFRDLYDAKYKNNFAPASMPRLIHLAIQSDQSTPSRNMHVQIVFGRLLPQIVTLTLLHFRQEGLFSIIQESMSNLQHLSLAGFEESLWWDLFTHAKGLKIETLHLDARALFIQNILTQRLIKVGRAEEEAIKVGKVFIYGSQFQESCWGYCLEDRDTGAFEWVRVEGGSGRSKRTPFMRLDGSCVEYQDD